MNPLLTERFKNWVLKWPLLTWPYNWGWNGPFQWVFRLAKLGSKKRVMWARVNCNTPFPGLGLRRALPVPTSFRANMAGRGARRFGAWRPGGLKMGFWRKSKKVLLLSTIYNMKVYIYNIFNTFMCKYMMIINSNYTCILLAVVYKNDVRTNEEVFVRALCLQWYWYDYLQADMSCIRKYIVIFEHRTISAVVHVIWFNWNQSEDGIILFYSPNMLIKHKCTCIMLYDIYIRMYHVVFEVVASAWNTSCLLPHWQGPEELAWLQPLPWHCREATRPCIKPVDGSYFPASTTERMHIKNPVVNDVGVQLPVVQLLSVGFFQKLRPFVFQMHNHGSPGKNHGGLKKKTTQPKSRPCIFFLVKL